jgi:hypothetical protein
MDVEGLIIQKILLCYLEISVYNIIMPTTYRVSITENGILNINGIDYQGGSPFKNGYDGASQITVDTDFWIIEEEFS